MSTRLRPWTPADLDDGPAIWIDGEEQTGAWHNGFLPGIIAKRGGPLQYSGANFPNGSVLESDSGGRKWITAPLAADYAPAGIAYSATQRFTPNAAVKRFGAEVLSCVAVELVMVSRRNASSTATGVVNIFNSGSAGSSTALYVRRQPGSVTAVTNTPSKTATALVGVSAGPTLHRTYADYATGTLGASAAGNTPVEASFSAPETGRFTPGAQTTFSAPSVGGIQYDYGEALVFFRRLASAEAQKVEGYLAHKWGVTASMPASHPYKSSPPVVEEWDGVSLSDDAEAALDDRAAPIGTLLLRQDEGGDFRLAKHKAQAGLALDDTLASAVLVSLFSDAPASEDEAERLSLDDRRGWWADALAPADGAWGSRLWCLDRTKPSAESARQAEERAKEALSWMLADGIANTIDAEAAWVRGASGERLELAVAIRPTPRLVSRYGEFWRATYEL